MEVFLWEGSNSEVLHVQHALLPQNYRHVIRVGPSRIRLLADWDDPGFCIDGDFSHKLKIKKLLDNWYNLQTIPRISVKDGRMTVHGL